MNYNFQKKSDPDNELDSLLENIFTVCNNEMGWACAKPSAELKPAPPVQSSDTNLNYAKQLIDDMKSQLDVIYNNLKTSSERHLDVNNNIMTLLSIQGSIDALNEDILSFQGSVDSFISAEENKPVAGVGNVQAINDIISIL